MQETDNINIEGTENLPDSTPTSVSDYTDESIQTLDWKEHIRLRPGMYIGKLGDGEAPDDGIYVLLKEVIDNSIDEHVMGFGKQINVDVTEHTVTIRDFGRGIPFGKLVDVANKINTGGKYKSDVYKKSGGLNGVGIKAVNAVSESFEISSYINGSMKTARFERGELLFESPEEATDEPTGTFVQFTPDNTIFEGFKYKEDYVQTLLRNYTFVNTGLKIIYNGKPYISRHGLLDLLRENMTKDPLYPIIHLKGEDIEIALTHAHQYGEEYYSFGNGQYTTLGGTHLTAFKESVSRTIKEFSNKNFDYSDIRNGIIAAVSIKVENPVFESQTKTKLGSKDMGPEGPTVAKFIGDFVKRELDNYLHRNPQTAEALIKKVQESEKERKEMAGVTKKARERAKKVNVHNKKLLDCTTHYNDVKGNEEEKLSTSIFITEGDSAAGSITKIRDVRTQAVFSLRGKPLNTYGLTKKVVYENDEFNALQAALNIEESIDDLRFNKVIIATDADVDGMHIRLLMITFFLQFFPELIRRGHVYVLQTPLFRVRNKKTARRGAKRKDGEAEDDTVYCYNDQERLDAIARFGANAEITRFKGLGEISPEEFKGFIGKNMRVDAVTLRKDDHSSRLLEFYMGKNTPERQGFIIDNLIVEDDSEIDKQ